MADYSMANRTIAYTLGRGRAYISDMSSTSGCMGATYFQDFGPRFFDTSSASGYMGAKGNQELGPKCLACHVPNVACHVMSISVMSINHLSCCVVSEFCVSECSCVAATLDSICVACKRLTRCNAF